MTVTEHAVVEVIPQTGSRVLFENRGSLHVARRTFENVRQMPFKGEFESEGGENFSGSIIAVLNSMGMKGERVALDAIDSRRLLALLAEKFTFVDSGPIIADASEVKTIDEIAIFKLNGAIGDAMLYDFESAIRPGIREHELLAVLAESLYRNHGEGLFTRFVGSGRNTNPWMSEAHDKMVMPGDLVAVGTDANGYQGYVIDVSRTFLCGTNPTAGQREAYWVAYEAVRGMTELLKPGLSYEEFARLVPWLPERFRERRYGIMVHSAWLEDGPLGIPYVEDVEDGRFDFPIGPFYLIWFCVLSATRAQLTRPSG